MNFLRINLILWLVLLSQGASAALQDYGVEFSITSNDNDSLGVMFRYQDANNYYRFYMDSELSFRRLDKTVNGVTTVLAEDSIAYTPGHTYDISIVAADDQISVSVGGQEILSVVDTSLSNGGVAFYSKANTGSYFDNLFIINLNDTNSIITYPFNSSTALEDLTIINEGSTSGPSSWTISSGKLRQASNIYQLNDGLRARGTYAVINASINSVASPSIVTSELATINASPASTSQINSAVSVNTSKNYLVAWEQEAASNDLGKTNLFYNLYHNNGTSLASAIKINDTNVTTNSTHSRPQVLLHSDNRVTAVWEDDLDGNGFYNIRLKQFDMAGAEVTPAFNVHSVVSKQQLKPSIATNSSGQIAVAWEDDALGNDNVYYRVFDPSGNPITNDIKINETAGTHYHPRLLLADNGYVLAVWQEDGDNNNYFNIRVRGFDASGQEVLTGFIANAAVAGHQYRPSISALSNNGFAIAFEDDSDQNGVFDIRVRGFNSNGSERFTERSLNMVSPVAQRDISLKSINNGGFVGVWTQTRDSVSYIVTRYFDGMGEPLTNDTQWSISGTEQTQPALAAAGTDTLLLSWSQKTGSATTTAVLGSALRYLSDSDSDGVGDVEDAFPNDPNEFKDTDNDGIGNNADTDDDNDGLPDEWEVINGLNPEVADANQDADNDGVSNGDEYADGTNPQSAVECNRQTCLPAIVAFDADSLEILVGESATLQWQTLRADSVTLTPIGSVSINGNTTVSPSATTTYTLTATSTAGQSSATITLPVMSVLSESTYNALGQRVLHRTSEKTTIFVYGPQGQLLAELDETGTAVVEYGYLEGQPLTHTVAPNTANTQTHYVHNDHLGTPQFLTNATGEIVWQVESQEPFGEVQINDDPGNNGQAIEFDLRFAGQFYDDESNLNYNYFRDYDPSIGRYIQSDPIGLDGGINTYTYVLNSPLKFVDPLGLFPAPWCSWWEIALGMCPDIPKDIPYNDAVDEWWDGKKDEYCSKPCDALESSCKRAMGPGCYMVGTPCLTPCEMLRQKCEVHKEKYCSPDDENAECGVM